MKAKAFFKRFGDIFFSLLFIVLFWWLILFLAFIDWAVIGFRRSPFYVNRTIGKDGKAIKVLKFVTLKPDPEYKLENYLKRKQPNEDKDFFRAIKEDPRISRFGKLLRKTSLDYLPSIFNVLKGDISFVGHALFDRISFTKLTQNQQAEYLKSKPGIFPTYRIFSFVFSNVFNARLDKGREDFFYNQFAYEGNEEKKEDYLFKKQLNTGEKKDVFISWNHNDESSATYLKDKFKENNLNVWFSDECCTGSIYRSCVTGIKNSLSWVILFTKNALKSKWIPKEIEFLFSEEMQEEGEIRKGCIIPVFASNDIYKKMRKIAEKDKNHPYNKIFELGPTNSGDEIAGIYSKDDKAIDNLIERIKSALIERTIFDYRKFFVSDCSYLHPFISAKIKNDITITATFNNNLFLNRKLKCKNEDYDINEFMEYVSHNKSVLIVGEGGTGKSWFLKNIVHNFFKDNKLFFIIETKKFFSHKENSQYDIVDYIINKVINSFCSSFPLTKDHLLNQMTKNETYILFDGLDEETSSKTIQLHIPQSLLSASNVHFIFASRNESSSPAVSNIFVLQRLSKNDAINLSANLIDVIYQSANEGNEGTISSRAAVAIYNAKENISKLIKTMSEEIYENPLLVTNFVLIYLNNKNIPINKKEIIAESIDMLISGLEDDKNDDLKLNSLIKDNMYALLAVLSYERKLGFYKSSKTIFEEYISKNIKRREIHAKSDALALYKFLKRRSILRGNNDMEDTVYHSLFADYFTSKYLFKTIYKLNLYNQIHQFIDFSDKDLFINLNDSYFQKDVVWKDVIFFLYTELDFVIFKTNHNHEIDTQHPSYKTLEYTTETLYKDKNSLIYKDMVSSLNNGGLYNKNSIESLLN